MRMKSRLDALERSGGVADISDHRLLVSLLGKRDALFWPWRILGKSRLGIHQRQRQYLDGSCGISLRADGKSDWKDAHEARNRLIRAGYASAIRSGGEVASLRLTLTGESTARKLVGKRLRSLRESIFAYVLLNADKWTSESVLFSQNFVGSPSDFDHYTELILPCLTSGLVVANCDCNHRIGYKRTSRAIPDEPIVDIDCDETMDDVYLEAFDAERNALRNCEPLDLSEVHIPLPPCVLEVYTPPSEVLPSQAPPPKDAAIPQSVYDDLYGAANGS
jgi:hypothetical protein